MSWEKDNQIPPSWSLEWVGIGEEGGHRHITEMCVSKYVMTDYSRCYEAATGDSGQCLVQKQEKTMLRGGEEHSRRRRGSDSICKGPVAERSWSAQGATMRTEWQTVVITEERYSRGC